MDAEKHPKAVQGDKWEPVLSKIEKINSKGIAKQKARGIENPTPPIAYNEVKPLPHPLEEKQIIGRLSGGDLAGGSCSSIALAYAANTVGLNVKGFRGDRGEEFFGTMANIRKIVAASGGEIVDDIDGYKSANTLLAKIAEGKQYYFITGAHAAIVRKRRGRLEYLELQAEKKKKNGFFPLTYKVLRGRFYVRKHQMKRKKWLKQTSVMIDIDNLKGDGGFREMMGYINTPSSQQKKRVKNNSR